VVRVAVVATSSTDGSGRTEADGSAGGAVHARELGERGSRVVFLHGLFGQGRNWTQIGKALADPERADSHRVLLVDLPHHGRSAWAEHFDYLQVADRVAGLLDPEDPVCVVGHSLGGKVAMVLALRRPELVERLCVVDVSPVAYDHLSAFEGYVAAMRGLDLASLEQRADADAALTDAVPDPTVRAFLLQNLRREGDGWRWQVDLEVLGRDLPVIGSWPEDRLTDVAPYGGPVLWVAGAGSDYVSQAYKPAMDRWFPGNRLVTIKGAGHWVHSEQPDVFLEVLRRFLDATRTGSAGTHSR
jgi:pimeloyl-ACP methyl ester carboxylesterase